MATASKRPDKTNAEAILPDDGGPITHEEPTAEEIAAEAYAIYITRGANHGRDMDDWLEAERILRFRRLDSDSVKRETAADRGMDDGA